MPIASRPEARQTRERSDGGGAGSCPRAAPVSARRPGRGCGARTGDAARHRRARRARNGGPAFAERRLRRRFAAARAVGRAVPVDLGQIGVAGGTLRRGRWIYPVRSNSRKSRPLPTVCPGVAFRSTGEGPEPAPQCARNAGVLYGLGNLIENAVSFAEKAVVIRAALDASRRSASSSPTMDRAFLERPGRIGEPYLSQRESAPQRRGRRRARPRPVHRPVTARTVPRHAPVRQRRAARPGRRRDCRVAPPGLRAGSTNGRLTYSWFTVRICGYDRTGWKRTRRRNRHQRPERRGDARQIVARRRRRQGCSANGWRGQCRRAGSPREPRSASPRR